MTAFTFPSAIGWSLHWLGSAETVSTFIRDYGRSLTLHVHYTIINFPHPPPPSLLTKLYFCLYTQTFTSRLNSAKAYCKQEAHVTDEVLNELEKLSSTLKFLPFHNLPKRNFNSQRLFKGLKMTMILLYKAVSSCWTASWEHVLLFLFPPHSKKTQQGMLWCKSFLKDTRQYRLEQQPTRKKYGWFLSFVVSVGKWSNFHFWK